MDLIKLIGFVYGKRYTRKQKNRFLEWVITRDYRESSECSIISSTVNRFKKTKNLVSLAKRPDALLFMTAYDTPPLRLFQSRGIDPQDKQGNMAREVRSMLFAHGTALLLMMGSVFLIYKAFTPYVTASVYLIGLALLIFALGLKAMNGFANPVNLNRNSISVVVCEQLNIQNPGTSILYYEGEPLLDICQPLTETLTRIAEPFETVVNLAFISVGSRCIIRYAPAQRHNAEALLDTLSHTKEMVIEGIMDDSLADRMMLIYCVNHQGLVSDTQSFKDSKINSRWLETLAAALAELKNAQ